MANTLEVNVLEDGPSRAILHVYISGDGTGELVNEVLVDPATTFFKPLANKPSITIEKIIYDITNFDAELEFEHLLTPFKAWTLSGHGHTTEFDKLGGIHDLSDSLDGTGRLLINTTGLDAGEKGTFMFLIRKY